MGALLDYSGKHMHYKGRRYRVDTSYDTVLLVQRLYGEETLDVADKVRQALKMLVISTFKVWLLSDADKAELLEEITKQRIQLPPRQQVGPPKKLMDFEADSDYIYASFKQAYDMDLLKERGRLEWRRFCELLDGLPENTKLKEVMRIRAMEVPEPTKYNWKERQNILQLKAHYALPVKGQGGQKGLDTLFYTLERAAGTR